MEFSEIIKLAGGLGALSDGHVLPYWQIFLGYSFRSCACKFFQIRFFVISSAPFYITLPSPGIIMMCPSHHHHHHHHHHHLQCVSYIFIYFEQFSSKISANFSLWLDMEIIDHCSTSQNVRPLLQCTWLPLPSCPTLPSSSRICQKFLLDFPPTRVIFATADFH